MTWLPVCDTEGHIVRREGSFQFSVFRIVVVAWLPVCDTEGHIVRREGSFQFSGGGVVMLRLPGWASSMISRGLSGAIPPERVIENRLFPQGIICDVVIEDSLRETIVTDGCSP